MHRRWLLAVLLLTIVAACAQPAAADSGWDDDVQPDSTATTPPPKTTASIKRTTLSAIIAQVAASKTNWWPEAGMLVAIALFIANYIRGRAVNEARAVAWAEAFATTDGLFDRNFALLGPGDGNDELLIKESQCRFLLYASGRRHCTSASATLNLRPRQDLLLTLWSVLFPSKDVLDVEVVMQEGAMPPMVLLVATKKLAKELTKELKVCLWSNHEFSHVAVFVHTNGGTSSTCVSGRGVVGAWGGGHTRPAGVVSLRLAHGAGRALEHPV